MKIKNVNLEWYAMRWDSNKKAVVKINVLFKMEEDIAKVVRKKEIKNREDLRFWLKNRLMYYFWCKSEMEIAVGGLFMKSMDDFKKVDVWSQIEPNLDRIVDYVIAEMKIEF